MVSAGAGAGVAERLPLESQGAEVASQLLLYTEAGAPKVPGPEAGGDMASGPCRSLVPGESMVAASAPVSPSVQRHPGC